MRKESVGNFRDVLNIFGIQGLLIVGWTLVFEVLPRWSQKSFDFAIQLSNNASGPALVRGTAGILVGWFVFLLPFLIIATLIGIFQVFYNSWKR